MFLLHINIGYPVVSETCEVVSAVSGVVGRDPCCNELIDSYNRFLPPTPGMDEHCYYHDLKAAGDGSTSVAIVNREFMGGHGIGIALSFNRNQYDQFTQWKMCAQGTYVIGPRGQLPRRGICRGPSRGMLKVLSSASPASTHGDHRADGRDDRGRGEDQGAGLYGSSRAGSWDGSWQSSQADSCQVRTAVGNLKLLTCQLSLSVANLPTSQLPNPTPWIRCLLSRPETIGIRFREPMLSTRPRTTSRDSSRADCSHGTVPLLKAAAPEPTMQFSSPALTVRVPFVFSLPTAQHGLEGVCGWWAVPDPGRADGTRRGDPRQRRRRRLGPVRDGSCKQSPRTRTSGMPMVVIGKEDGERIAAWMAEGLEVRTGVAIDADFLPGTVSYNVIGEQPGSHPDEGYVVVCAHYDTEYNSPGATTMV
jgi:hypothetical protein